MHSHYRALTVAVALTASLAALTACGTKAAGSGETDPGATTPPQVFQHRSLTCGNRVEEPARTSDSSDIVQLKISGTKRTEDKIVVGYTISAQKPDTYLAVPVGPTPVTVLLLRDGKIAGRQQSPAPTGTMHAGSALMYDVGAKPWTGSLQVDQLCPGVSWDDVAAASGRYEIEVVMSRQPGGANPASPPPAYLPDPLSVAGTAV